MKKVILYDNVMKHTLGSMSYKCLTSHSNYLSSPRIMYERACLILGIQKVVSLPFQVKVYHEYNESCPDLFERLCLQIIYFSNHIRLC